MSWSQFVLILMFSLVYARPSPELSLEEIEKELEQLTSEKNDPSDATKSDKAASTMDDTIKKTELEVPKELAEKTREVPKAKLETLEKTVKEAEQKKDATTKTEVEVAEFDKTDDFKDSPAYRRLMEFANVRGQPSIRKPNFPEAPHRRTYDYVKYDSDPSFRRPYHPEIPARRTYDLPEVPNRRPFDFSYRKNYDLPPFEDYSENRRTFSPNSDPVEALRKLIQSMHDSDSDENRGGFVANDDPREGWKEIHSVPDMTKTERMAIASGSWVPGSEPVKVPGEIPAPIKPDTAARSYNDVHKQLQDKETEDLINGKDGLTDLEKRRRYLMDQLAERIKSKVDEAAKRGLKVPDKIIDFLWNYETRRAVDAKADKSHFSH